MGAVQILSHSMVQSIEENSVRKGFDPRDFALVAEGGAGPLFAVPIAVEVGTPHVVVPPYPGIAAAMGLVATDMVYEYAATTYQRLSTLDAAGLLREELAFDADAAQPRRVEVHDRAAQIRVERLVCAQMAEPTDAPHERIVDEVLRVRTVAREEEREPVRRRHVTDVEIRQLALRLSHRCSFLRSEEDPCHTS